jgi:serine/threonine-protein kinase
MASVWAARLTGKHGFEKLVALKTVLPKHTENVDYLKMLLDEGYLLARIHHPNVASVIDQGEQNGIFYLVFEWVEGEQLSKLQRALTKKNSPMPLGIALRIASDICAGLHAAHEACDAQGSPLLLVHRDVSPQNVMISTNGDVKLIDFGIAKALDRVTDETRAGSVKGKIRYMAPEQVRGEPIDRRVDIWAAGVLLYQIVTGHPPFGTADKILVLEALIMNREPLALPNDIPPSVALPVWRALRPRRNERYDTAADMQKDLDRALAKIAGTVSSADVAAFLEEHVGDRIAARRTAISEALGAISSHSCTRHLEVRRSLASLSEVHTMNTPVEETLHSAPEPRLHPRVNPIATVSAFSPFEDKNVLQTSMAPASPSPLSPRLKSVLLFAGACVTSALISALLVIAVQGARTTDGNPSGPPESSQPAIPSHPPTRASHGVAHVAPPLVALKDSSNPPTPSASASAAPPPKPPLKRKASWVPSSI